MRIVAAIIVLLVIFVTVVAPTRPILANLPLLEICVACQFDGRRVRAGMALEQEGRVELGPLRPRFASELRAASFGARGAPKYRTLI